MVEIPVLYDRNKNDLLRGLKNGKLRRHLLARRWSSFSARLDSHSALWAFYSL